MPTYQPNIPIGTVKLLQDYLNLQGNFQQLDIAYGVNHVPFSDTSGVPPGGISGIHKFVQMPIQNPVNTIPAIQASQGAIYINTAPALSPATQSQLFYTADSLPTNNKAYQLTRVIDAGYSLFSTFVNNYNGVGTAYTGGWTFLPGGLLLQYGLYNAGAGGLAGAGTIMFPVVFTAAPYIVQPILIAKAGGTGSVHSVSVISGTITDAEFQWNLDTATTAQTGIYWTAIGK